MIKDIPKCRFISICLHTIGNCGETPIPIPFKYGGNLSLVKLKLSDHIGRLFIRGNCQMLATIKKFMRIAGYTFVFNPVK